MELVEAKWWSPLPDRAVRCELCPRHCVIPNGRRGFCGVRENHDGVLAALTYGRIASIAVDPIEKKPLREFLPGTRTFSFGTLGCNLGCIFCQNDSLSRGTYHNDCKYRILTPEDIVEIAELEHCPSISYTYNEPTVFAEYMMDIAQIAHCRGLKNVIVSNGFISNEVAEKLYPLMDAANIDMKGFSEEFYNQMCGASLAPVLDSLCLLHRLGVHLEITTLVIPGKNDGDEEIVRWLDWVKQNLDAGVPLHFSAYHPACECRIPATPPEVLYHIRDVARQRVENPIYLGNI